jgi:arginase family enzyme
LTAQALAQVRAVALQLAGQVEQIVRAGQLLLIIGGDCTITLGCSPACCVSTLTLRCSTSMVELKLPENCF